MKSKAAIAQKECKTDVTFSKEQPEDFFHETTKYLKSIGFKCREDKQKEIPQKVNAFYDHVSKLLIASHTMRVATYTNVVKSIEERTFESVEEIDKTIEGLLKEASRINLRQLVANIETSIALNHQWKLKSDRSHGR